MCEQKPCIQYGCFAGTKAIQYTVNIALIFQEKDKQLGEYSGWCIVIRVSAVFQVRTKGI